ncbi:MAG: hypothetical protein HYW49_13570 [Deltaproteobacteria bacterium]|nr:hypothetical protein [Deltaproteobacteria bacterium]
MFFLFAIASAMACPACSPSIFTGDSKNDAKLESGSFNKDCFGMDLAHETLDSASARALVHCLNSNGSIGAVERLTDKMTDAQLGSVVAVLNEQVLLDKKRIKNIDESIAQMDADGSLDRLMTALSRMLSSRHFVRGASRVLHEMFDADSLPALEVLAREMSDGAGPRANLARALEGVARGTGLESWREMASGLKLSVPLGRPGLRLLSDRFLEYAQAKIREPRPTGSLLMAGIADGSLLEGFRHFFSAHSEGGAPLTVGHQVQAFEQLVRFLNLERKDDVLFKLTRFLAALDRPIRCMGGTKEIPNGGRYLIRQFLDAAGPGTDLLRAPFEKIREEMLKLKLAGTVCELPEGFGDLMVLLEAFASYRETASDGAVIERRPLVTVIEFLRSIEVSDRLSDRLSQRAGSTEEGPYSGFLLGLFGDRSPVNAYANLADAAGELSRKDRRFIANLLYFLNATLGNEAGSGTDGVRNAARALIARRAELNGRSAYDALTGAMLKISKDSFHEFLLGVSEQVDAENEVLAPLAKETRNALLMNDVNPIVEALFAVMKNAAAHRAFFETMFSVAGSDEFEDAAGLASRMAANGNLKELLRGFFGLFRHSARGAASSPRTLAVPELSAIARTLDKSASREAAWKPLPVYWPRRSDQDRVRACQMLDFDLDLARTTDPRWAGQVQSLAACLNAEDRYPEFMEFAAEATDPKKPVARGKPLAAFLTDLISDLLRGERRTKAYDELSDYLMSQGSAADVRALQTALGFFLNSHGTDAAPARELFRVLAALGDRDLEGVQAILESMSAALVDPATKKADRRFAQAVALLKRAAEKSDKAPAVPAIPDEARVRSELVAAMREHEVASGPRANGPETVSEAVIARKIDAYLHSSRSGVPRFNYSNAAEFKRLLKPGLDRLSDSATRVLERTLEFFETLDGNPYTPQWLEGWFHRMSGEVHAIPYYFPGKIPGKSSPEVILANDFDLLELIARDADFSLREMGQPFGFILEKPSANFIVKYFSLLAQSGEQGEQKSGKLRAFVERTEADFERCYRISSSGISAPIVNAEVRRRMYNLKAVLPVLRRMLERGDLGVLRDLFLSALRATPRGKWNDYRREVNSLAAVVDIAEFGLLRSVGPLVWQRAGDGEVRPVPVAGLLDLLSRLAYVKKDGRRVPNHDARAMLDFLLRRDMRADAADPAAFDARYALLGGVIDAFFAIEDAEAKRHASYAFFNLVREMEALAPDARLSEKLISILAAAFGNIEGAEWLRRHADVFQTVLGRAEGARFLTALHETALENSRAEFHGLAAVCARAVDRLASRPGKVDAAIHFLTGLENNRDGSWAAFRGAIMRLQQDPAWAGFRARGIDGLGTRFVDWISNTRMSLPLKLQEFAARNVDSGSFLDLIRFIGRESKVPASPDGLYEKIRFLGEPKYVDGLQDFLTRVRVGVVDVGVVDLSAPSSIQPASSQFPH